MRKIRGGGNYASKYGIYIYIYVCVCVCVRVCMFVYVFVSHNLWYQLLGKEFVVLSRERRTMGGACRYYRGADKSLARPGRKQATATEDFEFHISYL